MMEGDAPALQGLHKDDLDGPWTLKQDYINKRHNTLLITWNIQSSFQVPKINRRRDEILLLDKYYVFVCIIGLYSCCNMSDFN